MAGKHLRQTLTQNHVEPQNGICMLLVVFTTRITFVCVPLNFMIIIIFRLNDTALRDVMYKNPELVFKGKAVNGV